MPKIDFSKKGENDYFKTQNRFFKAYFCNRQPICSTLVERVERVERVEIVEGFHWIYIILNLCVYVFMCFLPHLYKSLLVLLILSLVYTF